MKAPAESPAASWSERFLAPFSRVTSSGRFLAEIDGLRFIAIISVVLTHIFSDTAARVMVTSPLDHLVASGMHKGEVGVQIFFAISGFILALPFAERYLAHAPFAPLSDYYKRRVLRIEPPYLINMVVLMAIALVVHGADRFDRIPHFLASLFYVHNFVYGAWSEINFVAWSLEVEIQFYLLAPLLAKIFTLSSRTNRLWILILGMVACGIAAVWAQPLPYRIRMMLPFHLQYFLAGFLLAEIFVAEWAGKPKMTRGFGVAATIAWLGVFMVGDLPGWQPVLACLLFLAFYCSLRSRTWRLFLSNPWIAVTGGMCYTIYLWHFWIYAAYGRPAAALHFSDSFTISVLINSLIGVPFVLVISALLFVVVEKPFMRRDWPARLLKRFSLKRPAGQAA